MNPPQQQPLYQQHQHQHQHPLQSHPQHYASRQQLQATAHPLHTQLPPPLQSHLMGNNNHIVGLPKSSPQQSGQSPSQHSQSPPPPPTRHQSQQQAQLQTHLQHQHPGHQVSADPTQLIEAADFSLADGGAAKSTTIFNQAPVAVTTAAADDDVLEEKRYGCYRFGVLIAIIIILVLIGGTVPIAFVVTNRQIILLATCITLLLVAILVFVSVGWQHRAARQQRQKFGRDWAANGGAGAGGVRTTMARRSAGAGGNSQLHTAASEPLYTSVPTLYRQRPGVATPAAATAQSQPPPIAREFYNSSNKSTRTSWAFMGHQYNTVAVRQQQQLLQHQLKQQLLQQQQQQEQYKLRTNRKLFGPNSAGTSVVEVAQEEEETEQRRLYDVVDAEAELADAWTMTSSGRKTAAPRRIITTQI